MFAVDFTLQKFEFKDLVKEPIFIANFAAVFIKIHLKNSFNYGRE